MWGFMGLISGWQGGVGDGGRADATWACPPSPMGSDAMLERLGGECEHGTRLGQSSAFGSSEDLFEVGYELPRFVGGRSSQAEEFRFGSLLPRREEDVAGAMSSGDGA